MSLPQTFEPPAEETLILDAFALLPHIGPAIVLAHTAIEVCIGAALNVLAADSAGVQPELWKWINDRGDFRKAPSTSERLDVLMKVLGGHSLKEEARLWERFKSLNQVRNNFVHRGIVANEKGNAISVDRAKELLTGAWEITNWIESQLPEEHRRPRFNRVQMGVLFEIKPS